MAIHPQKLSSPPIIRPRDLLRLISLLFMSAFVIWAIWKAGNPGTWSWLTELDRPEQPSDRDTPPVVDPEREPADGPGRAPVPVDSVLEGASDGERFLVDDPNDPVDTKSRRDADARYHLIQVAHNAAAEDLAADARQNVRYTALLHQPEKHRGQVIHIQGDLRRVQHFELRRELPGVKRVYQGWVTAGSASRVYCVLFDELPADFPAEEAWNRQVTPVEFDGYFLKVLRTDDPRNKDKPVLVPVLIGKTVRLPAAPARSNVVSIATIISIVFVLTLIVSVAALWFYRRGDRRLAEKMAELRLSRPAETSDISWQDSPTQSSSQVSPNGEEDRTSEP